jgi:hypothetical protein
MASLYLSIEKSIGVKVRSELAGSSLDINFETSVQEGRTKG